MELYTRYPMMQPYLGSNFHGVGIPALLFIGESHYLPEGSVQHLTPEAWYGGSWSNLNEDERAYISTDAVLRNSKSMGFNNKAHSIWRNSFSVVNEHGPRYRDHTQVADDIAFCNFFLRPGLKGKSLFVAREDVDVANEAILFILEKLKPSAVVFLSSLARYHFRHVNAVPFVSTPHPSSRWWNRASAKYGGRSGRQVLADYIRALNWSKSFANAQEIVTAEK
jgi:hypothetical protein